MKIRKTGFTLAEILLTLTIIGVVAAMSIPAIIANTKKQENAAAFIKTYSTLNQAFIMLTSEMGTPNDFKATGLWNTSFDHVTPLNAIAKYLNITKNCGTGTGCWPAGNTTYKRLNGQLLYVVPENFSGMGSANAIMSNGTIISIFNSNVQCQLDGSFCGVAYVDVNGFKPPNTFGLDVFRLTIQKNGFTPPWPDVADTQCKVNKNGEACAAVVLKEGAINY